MRKASFDTNLSRPVLKAVLAIKEEFFFCLFDDDTELSRRLCMFWLF